LDAVNQELEANGIGGFLMEATEDLSSSADVTQTVADATAAVNTANDERNTLQGEVTRLKGELSTSNESLAAANARIEEMEDESAGDSRQGTDKSDDLNTGETPEQIMDALDHNKHADEILTP